MELIAELGHDSILLVFFLFFFLASRGNQYIKNYISIHTGTLDRGHNQHSVVIAAAEPRV